MGYNPIHTYLMNTKLSVKFGVSEVFFFSSFCLPNKTVFKLDERKLPHPQQNQSELLLFFGEDIHCPIPYPPPRYFYFWENVSDYLYQLRPFVKNKTVRAYFKSWETTDAIFKRPQWWLREENVATFLSIVHFHSAGRTSAPLARCWALRNSLTKTRRKE